MPSLGSNPTVSLDPAAPVVWTKERGKFHTKIDLPPTSTSTTEYELPTNTPDPVIPFDGAQRIMAVADVDPLNDMGGACVNFEFPDKTVIKMQMKIDHTPHLPQSPFTCRRAFPHGGINICNHKQLNKLNDLDKKEGCYKAVSKEYCGLDDRGVWRCVPLPVGAVCHPVLLHVTCKTDPNGNFVCMKGRLCVRGDRMLPDRDFGLCYAPAAQLRTARCEIARCVAKDYNCKAIDVSQASTFGYPDRRTYIGCPPGRIPPPAPRLTCPLKPTGDGPLFTADESESSWHSKRYDTTAATGRMAMELVRNPYGVPSAPRRWHMEIHNMFLYGKALSLPRQTRASSSKETFG
jgi:hypothetical protein